MSENDKPSAGGRWCISSNDEHGFHGDYATREEAIADAANDLGLAPGDAFYLGQASIPTPAAASPCAENIIDNAICEAGDNYGEAAEDWLAIVGKEETADLQRRLNAAWEEWLRAHGLEAHFWTIDDVETAVVPEKATP
jgi:hypothetical protein